MAEYGEQIIDQVVITKYLRARKLEIDYPKGLSPSMRVDREWCVNTNGEESFEPGDSFISSLPENMLEEFPLRNPLTNEIIPEMTMSYQNLYIALFSFVWAVMEQHDANN